MNEIQLNQKISLAIELTEKAYPNQPGIDQVGGIVLSLPPEVFMQLDIPAIAALLSSVLALIQKAASITAMLSSEQGDPEEN